jgi:competence ComEA-like helix-hairpin-helix protein
MNANRLRDYFDFSKKERTGIITLLVLLLVIWLLPRFIPPTSHFDQQDFESFKAQITQLKQQEKNRDTTAENLSARYNPPQSPASRAATTLFYFDPNTASPEEWARLGIKDKTVQTIQHYISKGGRFYKATDIGRIYGIKKTDFERLLPYVRITSGLNEKPKEKVVLSSLAMQKAVPERIEINSADTTVFIALPGIGSKLAGRIIKFREKLGGFYNTAQIAEVYGLADSVFTKINPKLQCNPALVKQININTAGLEALKAHPYIKYQLANAVIQYRNQHGNFQSPEDLKRVALVTDEIFNKIAPYLTVD